MTIAIALIGFGAAMMQGGAGDWYLGAIPIVIGVVLLIIDKYILGNYEY